MARTPQDLVNAEVLCCMSSIVHTLAQGYGAGAQLPREVVELHEQAFELACPIDDWEEAAIQAGWSKASGVWRHDPEYFWSGTDDPLTYDALEELQRFQLDEPYAREVYEHHAVTDWFADKLIEQGEKVDKDFAGLCVWARTTTGQAIYADGVVERICAKANAS